MFISLIVIGLYFLPYAMIPGVVTDLLLIGPISLGLAIVTFMAGLVLYLWAPTKNIGMYAFIVYGLLTLTTADLVLSTGETSSPFVALWIVVAVFCGIFGFKGFALLAAGASGYVGYAFYTNATPEVIIIACVAGFAPLIASFIIWHTRSTKESAKDKAYNELASELSQEATKSDVVISAINDGVVSVDKKGVIQLINPAAQRIIGWGQNDAVGLSYKSVVKLIDRADKPISGGNDPVEKVLTTNQEVHSEDYALLTESGKKVLLSIIVSPIGHPSNGAIIVFRDMTKEKAEEREQAEFISTASHEMRTPVASIEGYLGLVLNPATAQIDEKARDYVTKAQASAQHLGRLFQDLLDVSKAEDGRMTNDPSVIDVIEFVADVVEGLKPKAVAKNLRFLFKPRPEDRPSNDRLVAPVFYVHVDSDHLREIIANLVENAIKYTPAGDVVIDVTGKENKVVISVQDSGIGIPAEDIPHLFQKFYRVDNSDTREIGGTGLGLYLCRRLSEVMGGTIRVESEYKRGSTFFLELPRIDHEEAERLLEASTTADSFSGTPPGVETSADALTEISDELSQMSAIQGAVPSQTIAVAPPAQPLYVPPEAPSPQPSGPQPIAPTVQASPDPANIPLSQIEQNPSAYTTGRAPVQVPVRGQDSNQP